MNILIVNDDGINSKGLHLLARSLLPYGNIYIAAPNNHQSGMSHAITIAKKINIYEVDNFMGVRKAIAIDGTPADATKVGIKYFDVDFDLVVSGINDGPNIAKDILYSGTVGAAVEAALLGIPAIAISADSLDVSYLFDETAKLLDEIIESKVYEDNILNINFPKQTFLKPKGVKYTHQGLSYSHTEYLKADSEYEYHVKFSKMMYKEHQTSDVYAFEEGYISITPLLIDKTNYKTLKKLGADLSE